MYVIEDRDHSEVEMSSSAESSGGMSRTMTVYDPFCVCAQSVFLCSLTKGKKVKFSHTRYRALGPELIPVYRQSGSLTGE